MSPDVVVTTETWLHELHHSNSIHIPGFSLHRRDRPIGRGGGVCVYISNTIPSKRRLDLENPLYECMWIWSRRHRLPRPLSGVMIAAIYNPPDKSSQEQKDIMVYLIDTIDVVCNRYPDCGIAILGDFNKLDASDLTLHHNLKQVVECTTRESSILDLIVTNISKYYYSPVQNAPLGTSDHNIITWVPLSKDSRNHDLGDFPPKKKCAMKLFPKSSIDAFGRWTYRHSWFSDLAESPSPDEMAESLTSDLKSAIDLFFPTKTVRIHNTDKPWMTSSIKQLIVERQRAYYLGTREQFKHIKNKVRKAIAERKETFYRENVCNRSSNPRRWWNLINKLSGRSTNTTTLCYEDEDGNVISGLNLATRLNKFYISVASDILPLDNATLPAFLPAQQELPTISTFEVCGKLSKLNPRKTIGPDGIPNRIWKEFAPELAGPVTKIFNASFSSGLFPKLWKDSYVSPVPKTTPVTCDDDLRPISLTPCISKVQEDFAVKWLIEDVQSEIDPQQFGSLKGSSTTYCLLDMFENWLSSLDQPSQYLRICFLDFSKAFDHIDHNILVRKLLGLGVRRHLILWLCSFLSSRRQAVKFSSFLTEWQSTHAGVPQGTKLGPILFVVMINDLALKSPLKANHWEYVDDMSLSEVINIDTPSRLQSDLDQISNWSTSNNMSLNPKKCKEIAICPLKISPDLDSLSINDIPLDTVSSHKLLGLKLMDTLKWNDNSKNIVTKASKRIYIIRVLKRTHLYINIVSFNE